MGCGSDLWPYRGIAEFGETGNRMGHKFIGIVEDVGPAPARAYFDELLPNVLEGRIEPGRVFDFAGDLEKLPDGYQAMDERKAIKALIEF